MHLPKNQLNLSICIQLIVSCLFLLQTNSIAQKTGIGINITGSPANSKALLDIDATGMNQKAGLLLPRMTTMERNDIAAPVPESLLIYNTDDHCFEANYNGSWVAWACLGGCQIPAQPKADTNSATQTTITWKWNRVTVASGYQWNTLSTFPGAGINSVPGSSYTQTGLTCNTSYTLYVWAVNICGIYSTPFMLTQSTPCCNVDCGGSGNIGNFAGNSIFGFSGDGGPAKCAEINGPLGVAVDFLGNVYITGNYEHRIRKVNTSGIISTIAGNGTAGYSGDGGAATNAEINSPAGITVDGNGNIYFADVANNRVRKINISTGIITNIAGNGIAGFAGDGGQATVAKLNIPREVAVDASGNVYVADSYNYRIRKINVSTGIISTVAGNGNGGYTGDGGQATAAKLGKGAFNDGPEGVAVDVSGNFYIADTYNNVIRIVNSSGIISTFAGNGTGGYSGDGGPATASEMGSVSEPGPTGITIDASGNAYIADYANSVIRKVDTSGTISTFAGSTIGFSGDGGPATNAKFWYEYGGIAIDKSGNVYIADFYNSRVRIVCK